MNRFYKNNFPDYEENQSFDFEKSKESIKNFLNVDSNILSYLNLDDQNYKKNDVYLGKYGILLTYLKLYQKFPQYRQNFLEVYKKISVEHKEKLSPSISFHFGNAGIFVIEAIIQHLIFNDKKSRDKYLTNLACLFEKACSDNENYENELLYGKTSLLYAICFVEKELNFSLNKIDHLFDINELKRKLTKKIIELGYRGKKNSNLNLKYFWHGTEYLGAAHGYAGIYYVLLKNRNFFETETILFDLISSIINLIKIQFESGNFAARMDSKKDELVQWCHGAPGFLALLTETFDVCEKHEQLKQYCPLVLQSVERCLDLTWKQGILCKGMNLCHGVSGNAYAFLTWYRKTGNKKSLYRAMKFAEYCLKWNEKELELSDRPLSLYEGVAGTIYFLLDILEPEKSSFPGFEF